VTRTCKVAIFPAEKACMNSEAQSTNAVLLVRPARFGFHAEAAESNAFAAAADDPEISMRAQREFEGLERRLADAGVQVLVLDDTPEPARPDAIFPNNWVSFHADGTLVLYPMATAARRLEREPQRLTELLSLSGFDVLRVVDLIVHEREGRFLEGTGSLVLDRPRSRAFASLSARTDAAAVAAFDEALGYSTFLFDARDRSGRPIYHTNVLLSLGTSFAMLCTEAVVPEHRAPLIEQIAATGRTLIEVEYEQLRQFACNLIELRSRSGDSVIALSSAAFNSFTPEQIRQLESFGTLVETPIPTIEAVGGGSVRCMIADIHLPRKS
jgi:hypothetical protein